MSVITVDLPAKYHRLYPEPLDDSIYIPNGNSGLFSYITSGSAYNGQRLLVHYPYFDQNITLMKGNGSILIPTIEMPSGQEYVMKTYSNNKYLLVYYYNGGGLFSSLSQAYRTTDGLAMAMLYQASLFANSDTSIDYLLEYDNFTYTFTQANFVDNTVPVPETDSGVSRISSVANSNFFFTTKTSDFGIMPRRAFNKRTRLWVKANEYCSVVGVN